MLTVADLLAYLRLDVTQWSAGAKQAQKDIVETANVAESAAKRMADAIRKQNPGASTADINKALGGLGFKKEEIAALGAITGAAAPAEKAVAAVTGALSQSTRAMRLMGMVVGSELSPALGPAASRLASMGVIAGSFSASIAGAIVAVGAIAFAVGEWAASAERLSAAQGKANLAVKGLELGPLTAQVKAAQEQLANWQASQRGTLGQIITGYWSELFSRLGARMGFGEAPETTMKRVGRQQAQVQPDVDAQKIAALRAAYDAAAEASAGFNVQRAIEAGNYPQAHAYLEAEVTALRAGTAEKVRAAEATAKLELAQAKLYDRAAVPGIEARLRIEKDTLQLAAQTQEQERRRAEERARIASQSWLADESLRRLRRDQLLSAALGGAGAAPRGVGAVNAYADELRRESQVETAAYNQKRALQAGAVFQSAEALRKIDEDHRNAQAEIVTREAAVYAQRALAERKAQDELQKAVETTRQVQFTALEDVLTQEGRVTDAVRVGTAARVEQAGVERARRLSEIDRLVQEGMLDEQRAAAMRVAAEAQASAQVLAIRAKELQGLRGIVSAGAGAEAGLFGKLPGGTQGLQLQTGLTEVEKIRTQVISLNEGLKTLQDAGTISPSEASDAARRYGEALGQVLDQVQAKYKPGGFGQVGEPVVVRMIDQLRSALQGGGLGGAADAAGLFQAKMRELQAGMTDLNAAVDSGTQRWQSIIDDLASRVPAAAAATQAALAELRGEAASLSVQLDALKASIDKVTTGGAAVKAPPSPFQPSAPPGPSSSQPTVDTTGGSPTLPSTDPAQFSTTDPVTVEAATGD